MLAMTAVIVDCTSKMSF